jgi:hypothetical protein
MVNSIDVTDQLSRVEQAITDIESRPLAHRSKCRALLAALYRQRKALARAALDDCACAAPRKRIRVNIPKMAAE